MEMSIEFKSDDGTVTNDHVFSVWSRTFIEAGEKFGKTFRIADLAKGYIVDAGFDEVVEKKFKLPVGGWSSDPKYKELGRWNLLHCEQGIEGWAMALLTRVLGVRRPAMLLPVQLIDYDLSPVELYRGSSVLGLDEGWASQSQDARLL